ncbi:MAG: hypothetical protein V3T48_10170 [Vicinamibacterales bacterium]
MSSAPAPWRPTLRTATSLGTKALYVLAVVIFLVSIGRYYDRDTGFTQLIIFGDTFDEQALPAVRAVPHYVHRDSGGYDGQFYAQLAVDPLVRDPAIVDALDTVAYRARRILFSWTAFLLGLGQPRWILQAYALQNVLCWLALAWVLLRWLPPVDIKNFFLWFGCLFGSGLIISVRFALLELPSVLLLALAIIAMERGRPWVAVAIGGLSGLGRETNLLVGASVVQPEHVARTRRDMAMAAVRVATLGAPLAIWVLYLVTSGHDMWVSSPSGNFGAPFAAYVTKWGATLSELRDAGWGSFARFSLMGLVSLTTQATVLVRLARWTSPWWRVGAAYVVLMVVLGPDVWGGYPGAALRVVMPMTIAFNLLLPRTRWFWPLAILGNLSVWHGLDALGVPVLSVYL